MSPTEKPPVDDLAPTPESELILESGEGRETEGDEGEEGEGGKKSGSGGGGKKPAVEAKEVILEEENLEEYDSETLIEKLKMLVWAPFSTMVPGASSFESESDLKRTLFLGQIGLMTNQIHPADIADPQLIAKLEQRNQMRQEIFKAEMAASSAGNAADLAAGLIAAGPPPEVAQKREQKKEQKQQISQPKEASLDAVAESDHSKSDSEQKNKQTSPEVKTDISSETKSFADEQDYSQDKAKPKDSGLGLDVIVDLIDGPGKNTEYDVVSAQAGSLKGLAEIATVFNATAQQTEYNQPEQRVDLRFADPAPKLESAGPMNSV